jgi:hypothetical protein
MEHGQVIWAGAFYTARMARYQDKPAEVGNEAGHWALRAWRICCRRSAMAERATHDEPG